MTDQTTSELVDAYGFAFTDEHRRIEQLLRLLEARAEALAPRAHESPRRPPLSVIRGGAE